MKSSEEIKMEKELVLRCQKGERSAFEELYLKYHRGVYTFLVGMLRSPHAAEDVAQDIFVKLFSQIRSYRFQSPFPHWLFRMARNAAIDRIRREKVRRAVSLDAEVENVHPIQERLAGNAVLPSDKPEKEERAQSVRRAVAELPENFKTVLVMREWEDLPYEDIAQRLRISEGTVKSRLFRARQILAKKLKAYRVY